MTTRFLSIKLNRLLVLAALATVLMFSSLFGQDQTGRTYTKEDFINIDGSSLQEKLDRAEKQFRGSKQGDSYWVAYHFQAREGMSVGPFSGYVYEDSDGIRLYRKEDPNGIAIFFLTSWIAHLALRHWHESAIRREN